MNSSIKLDINWEIHLIILQHELVHDGQEISSKFSHIFMIFLRVQSCLVNLSCSFAISVFKMRLIRLDFFPKKVKLPVFATHYLLVSPVRNH